MTILEHISQMKIGADGGALVGWTDAGTFERGCGYVERVKEIASAYNLLAGVVDGTTRYYTNVRIEVNGFLDAICSCPVGKRCKHSVALILKARQMMLDREQIQSTIPSEWTSRPEERIREIERKIEEQWRQQKLEEERRVVQQVHEEECERECEDAFWRDYTALREALLASCRNDSAEKIKAAAETFLEWADDDELYQHPRLSQKVWGAVDPTMSAVIETFEANSVDPADTITWAYELNAPDRGLSIGDRLESLRNSPEGQYAQPSVWEKLANRFQEKLDAIPEADYSAGDSLSRPWYWVWALRTAWERAGKIENAVNCYLRFVSRIGNWEEVVQYLNRHQLYDKAIEIAREGIRASQASSDYAWDYDVEMQEHLADAFSGKGDHLMAAAVRAEAFLDRIGAYDEKRTVKQFDRILSDAENAGVREQVRKSLIHALETGLNPSSIVTSKFQPLKQEFDWKPVPKPVVYRIKTTSADAPPWPLPKANEGIRLFDSRWQDCKWFCQQDMEFLLKLAIVGGDKDEIAKRFDDVWNNPNAGGHNPFDNGFPLDDDKAKMLEMIMGAMQGCRDDIVRRLANLRKYCYVREDRDGVECVVRVIKRLGENADVEVFE